MHAIELPAWAVARGRALNHFPTLAVGRAALVNIDMQNVFLAEDQVFGNVHARAIVSPVNALSQAMQGAGAPVIWTRQTHTFEAPLAPADLTVDKYRYGAFSCPAGALPKTLERLGVEMLVITGTLTNVCVDSTAREANMAGYKVLVVADATAAVTDAEHNAALLNLRLNFADVRRTREVLRMIQALSR